MPAIVPILGETKRAGYCVRLNTEVRPESLIDALIFPFNLSRCVAETFATGANLIQKMVGNEPVVYNPLGIGCVTPVGDYLL